jgi:hypothetical protein
MNRFTTCQPIRTSAPTATRRIFVLLFCGLWLFPSFRLQAQLIYTNRQNAIIITGFSGNVVDLIIPDTVNGLPVTAVETGAFRGRQELKSVTLPNSVTSIGGHAFDGCTGLKSVVLPDSVTSVGDWAFLKCTSLTNVIIGSSVTNFGAFAFYNCSALSRVTFGNRVTSIGELAFYGCNSLASVTVPDSVRNIGYEAFWNCRSLTNVLIGHGVTSIEESAFFGCTRLNSLSIGNSVTNIAASAFGACNSLTKVPLPASVRNIGELAFNNCTNLTSVTLPNSVKTIGASAFAGCTRLASVIFEGNKPPDPSALFQSASPTVYYLPGTTGWGSAYAGRPALLWNPTASTAAPGFGFKDGVFGFNITGTLGISVIVEASRDLAQTAWTPISTNTLTGGPSYFTDSSSTANAKSFYRFRTP